MSGVIEEFTLQTSPNQPKPQCGRVASWTSVQTLFVSHHKSRRKTRWYPGSSGRNLKGSADFHSAVKASFTPHTQCAERIVRKPNAYTCSPCVCTKEACQVSNSIPTVNNPCPFDRVHAWNFYEQCRAGLKQRIRIPGAVTWMF